MDNEDVVLTEILPGPESEITPVPTEILSDDEFDNIDIYLNRLDTYIPEIENGFYAVKHNFGYLKSYFMEYLNASTDNNIENFECFVNYTEEVLKPALRKIKMYGDIKKLIKDIISGYTVVLKNETDAEALGVHENTNYVSDLDYDVVYDGYYDTEKPEYLNGTALVNGEIVSYVDDANREAAIKYSKFLIEAFKTRVGEVSYIKDLEEKEDVSNINFYFLEALEKKLRSLKEEINTLGSVQLRQFGEIVSAIETVPGATIMVPEEIQLPIED